MKILTISIAAYNVEKYIEKCLQHLCDSSVIDELEIFVIDDGGNDSTVKRAEKYAEAFPQSVFIVQKENGGYGTTVNYSVSHATGLYHKILDGDDYFSTEGIEKLVEFLRQNDVDWIVTDTQRFIEDGELLDVDTRWHSYAGKIHSIEDVEPIGTPGMWESTFKTTLLKESIRELPKHTLYTDMLYVTYPLPLVRTVAFLPFVVYNYRLGRDGQSVTKESRIKHCEENLSNIQIIIDYYYEKNGDALAPLVQKRFHVYYKWYILNIMLLPASKNNYKRIAEYEKRAKQQYRSFYDNVKESKNILLVRYLKYPGYVIAEAIGVKNW